jgi:hypothetical protein
MIPPHHRTPGLAGRMQRTPLPKPSLGQFHIHDVMLRIEHDRGFGEIVMGVSMRVRGRQTPTRFTTTRQEVRIPWDEADALREDLGDVLRERMCHMVHEAVCHEVDEWLTFDGVQFAEPHADDNPVYR